MRRFSALFLALILPFTAAQIITTTDVNGETIVENITIDPILQIPTTSIISTIIAAAVTQTVTTLDPLGQTVVEVITGDGAGDSQTQTIATLTPDAGGGQGPVGQPGPTGAAGAATPFTYTTTNANGDTIPVVATFTPSFATTVMPSATFKATVMDYSVYTASYATQAPQAANANSNQNGALRQSTGWWGPCLSVMISVAGGFVLVLGA